MAPLIPRRPPPEDAGDTMPSLDGPVPFAAVQDVGRTEPVFAPPPSPLIQPEERVAGAFVDRSGAYEVVDTGRQARALPAPSTTPVVAVVELVDRDGQVRQAIAAHHFPIWIGRALDNDIVLSDPHVAGSHVCVDLGARGPELLVGTTRNGVGIGRRRLASGQRYVLPDDVPVDLEVGRTRLRVRLPGHPVAPEIPLASARPLGQRLAPIVVAGLLLVLGMVFNTYLDTDPDNLGRAIGNMLMTSAIGAAIWCSAWALLSKTFTRQSHFGWHVKVFLYASLGLLAVGALPAATAFAFSWPWVSDFAFVGTIVVGAAALYYHLLAVEPGKHRLLRWVAVAGAVAGIGVSLWLNQQRTDQWGDELYMNHLFPPAMRVAKPRPVDGFVEGLASLKPGLDKKAKKSEGNEEAGSPDE